MFITTKELIKTIENLGYKFIVMSYHKRYGFEMCLELQDNSKLIPKNLRTILMERIQDVGFHLTGNLGCDFVIQHEITYKQNDNNYYKVIQTQQMTLF